jgi:hypothetical protein
MMDEHFLIKSVRLLNHLYALERKGSARGAKKSRKEVTWLKRAYREHSLYTPVARDLGDLSCSLLEKSKQRSSSCEGLSEDFEGVFHVLKGKGAVLEAGRLRGSLSTP